MPYSVIQAPTAGGTGASSSSTGTFGVNTTSGNLMICVAHLDRYDASPTVDAAPTCARSGGETFTKIGWVNTNTNRQAHVFAAEVTQTATTAVTVTENVGANCDIIECRAFEVSGMAAVGSLWLASNGTYHNFPGTGSKGSGLLGTLSSQPAMLLAYGYSVSGTCAVDTGYTDIITSGGDVLSHKRLTATTSVEATVNVTSDGSIYVWGFALLEGAAGAPRQMMHLSKLMGV